MFKHRRGHALRNGRASVEGQAYVLTTVTQDRVRWFDDFWLACLAYRTLVQPKLWADASLVAWVLMPDHAHLLLTLGGDATLSNVAQRVKSVISLEVGRQVGAKGIWQRGFHDHAIRSDECLRSVARYVVFNPVRAGIVQKVGDYPFWDAQWVSPESNPLDV